MRGTANLGQSTKMSLSQSSIQNKKPNDGTPSFIGGSYGHKSSYQERCGSINLIANAILQVDVEGAALGPTCAGFNIRD